MIWRCGNWTSPGGIPTHCGRWWGAADEARTAGSVGSSLSAGAGGSGVVWTGEEGDYYLNSVILHPYKYIF